jgi:ABC-type sugar transport system substrate-binding protein
VKKLLAFIAAGVAASVFSPAAAQEKPTICYVTFSLQVGYFQEGVNGAKKAADELGAELVVLDPQADAGKQVTMFEDCISRKSSAIIIDPIESGSLAGAIEEAGKAGIPIAALDTPVDSPYVVTQLGIPQKDASVTFGQFAAGYIIGALKGQASIGIMLASTEVQLARRDGFLEALAAVPGAKVVATGDGRNILERATAEAENMLTANPSINVIYATGEPQMQGAIAAAQSQGRDDIAFFTWDEIQGLFAPLLEKGKLIGYLRQRPALGGEMAVRFLVDKLNGKAVPAKYTYSPILITPYNYKAK